MVTWSIATLCLHSLGLRYSSWCADIAHVVSDFVMGVRLISGVFFLRKVPCQMEIWWQAYVSEQHLLVERQTLRNNLYQLHTYLVILVPFPRDLLTVSECVSCTLDSLRQLEPGLWVETQPGLSVTFPHLWFLIAYSINKMVLNAVSDQKLEVGRLRNKGTGSVSLRDSATAHTVMQHWYFLHV